MLENLTQGKLLQAQVVGRAEDGVPFVNVFQIQPNSAVSKEKIVPYIYGLLESQGI